MGTYLSTPVTEKGEESGESLDCPDVPCAWGVVDMQGWRKSMEDAHTAVTDIPLPGADEDGNQSSDAKVFGVFDGHGGPEVARFCQLYLVSVLQKQPSWQQGPIPVKNDSLPNHDDLDACAATSVGKALRATFHSLDRMIDDQNRRHEIIQLRNMKPQVGERKEVSDIPPPIDIAHISPPEFYKSNSALGVDKQPMGLTPTTIDEGTERLQKQQDETKDGDASTSTSETGDASTKDTPSSASDNDNKDDNLDKTSDDSKDDDSLEPCGKEEASKLDQDMMLDDGDGDGEKEEVSSSNPAPVAEPNHGNVTTMFQKILAFGGAAGQVAVDVKSEMQTGNLTNLNSGPNARQPTLVHQGRMICNLPEHPIHAGATAIVAVITGRVLTVANAGDSRAVLCRCNGVVQPLSFDHKPQQDREIQRIRRAGGFVNQFGRINGNLNLSRSIGDLKYKQVPGIPPSDQMITAEPDILQIGLLPDDEFIILGCDGIWDCLSNESAVEYVRKRIDSKSPTEIGKEMLDEIISDDPRVTQGIGGDNMTVMIIDLQPKTRSWRKSSSSSSSSPSEPPSANSASGAEQN